MPNELQPGQVLDDRFEVQEVINRGGMAWICTALDRKTGGVVALKIPLLKYESDPGFFSRFQREEAIGLSLDHPSILHFFSTDNPKSRPYLVTEYLKGRTLATHLAEHRPLPEAEAARIASQICAGLDYLHRHGVIHRDLKPDNIMLCEDGSLRIMDFGIAKAEQSRRLTFGGLTPTMGTPDYIAPEQVQGKRGDARTDLYCLGAMLYEMTTGTMPYEGDSPYVIMNARLAGDPEAPRKRNAHLTPVIEEIILHALERDPAKRYQSAAEMKAELDNYEAVSLTSRFERLQPARYVIGPRALWRWVAVGLAVQAILFAFIFWCLSHRRQARPHGEIHVQADEPVAAMSLGWKLQAGTPGSLAAGAAALRSAAVLGCEFQHLPGASIYPRDGYVTGPELHSAVHQIARMYENVV